jgi:hypothetical protein
MVGGSAIISNFQAIFINNVIPDRSIPLHLASWIPSYVISIEACCQDSAALPNECQPVQFLYRSLFRLCDALISILDSSYCHLPCPLDVSSNDVLVSTSA